MLGRQAEEKPDSPASLPVFHDLNLDQIFLALTHGREEYDLGPLLRGPLSDTESIAYRQEVMKDLESPPLRGQVEAFSERMREMRRCLVQGDKLHNEYQKMSWFLDAVDTYCDGVEGLLGGLSKSAPKSRGMQELIRFLGSYTSSAGFVTLVSDTKKLKQRISEVRYRIHIRGLLVSVGKYGGEPDYSAEVEETFRKFQEGEVGEYAVRDRLRRDAPDMNSVEEGIMDMIVRLYPDSFGELATYCRTHVGYLDKNVSRFDKEVQFYLAYLQLIQDMKAAGLDFCYPTVDDRSKSVRATETFDLALALRLVHEGASVVRNDFSLSGRERMLVVSGPNQGGKTTFARAFGQVHYLARLGYPVPGKEAQLFLSDNIFTHFEKEEQIENLRGKLQDELIRIHDQLQRATGRSVMIVNEGFSSTTASDALFLGKEVLRRAIDIGCIGVYVTFVDELSRLGEATVSVVSSVVPDNPTQRTFKMVRKPADGRAYAMAIAEKYELTRRYVKRRLSR